MDTIKYYLPGIILILIAILVVAMPEILVAFIASLIIVAGIAALYVGHNIRKSQIEFRHMDDRFSDEDSFGHGFLRRPLFRDWHKWF